MTSTCGLRIALRSARGELGAGLAAGDVERGDDEVESREQVVLVVEPAVGPDLELAAVQEAEALGRGRGRGDPGGLLAREPRVELGDDPALLLDPLGVRPWAIASDCCGR